MVKPANLTDKQWAFVLEYPKDWNATQAAIRAGYSQNTAGATGWENLTKPEIKEALSRVYTELAMPVEEMFARIAAVARTDNDLTALGMIGKGHAAFTDKVTQQGELVIRVVRE